MHGNYIARSLQKDIESSLSYFPACAILGPRQVGKSTIAKTILTQWEGSIYLDLERPSDLAKLNQPELYLESYRDRLVCLDEIQRKPDLFPVLRSLIDDQNLPGQYLILGSASPELLRQSAESLAGRIEYLELMPFRYTELNPDDFMTYWVRGGYPGSYLAPTSPLSSRWRDQFITTFLERDLRNLDIHITTETIRRFWHMCAHYHGQLLNLSKIGQALGVSHSTIHHYVDVMVSTFMIRLLPPFTSNQKKRLVKSPKLYLRDAGLCHRLLQIRDFDDLAGHPVFGASFEGVVVDNVISSLPDWTPSFYRTGHGAEIDLILSNGTRHIAIECKATKSPTVSKGFYLSCDELDIQRRYVISLVNEAYYGSHGTLICNLHYFLTEVANRL